jgi:Xaa-Pro dipeptidase
MYFPRAEYERRWQRFYEELGRRGFSSAVVWGQSAGSYERCGNILYLSNYFSNQSGHEEDTPGWNGIGFTAAVMADGEPPDLVVDAPDFPETELVAGRVSWEPKLIEGVARVVRDRGLAGEVALVGTDFLPMRYGWILEAELPGIRLVPADDLLAPIRRRKSALELDCYREAARGSSAALSALLEVAVRGGTQAEAAGAGAAQLIRHGGFPHMIPVASGTGTGLYHFAGDPITGSSREVVMRDGDMVRAWIYGPAWQGYWLDPGRTVVVGGRPTAAQRDLIRAGNAIVGRLIDEIRPGVPVADVTALGARLRRESGTEDDQPGKMWPLYGHGVGLFWERPWLLEDPVSAGEDVFCESDVLGVEVFLHWPEVGSVGVEQNLIVGADGAEILTTTPLEWW